MMIGVTVHRFLTCSSTNDLAKRLAQEGAAEGTAVVAEEQTAGRGTKGRSWHSPRGQGFYASVVLRPPQSDIALLPVVAGVATAEAVRKAVGLAVRLKWPNDILWRRRKLGGILCESGFMGSEVGYAVLGIGLNVSQAKRDFPAGIRGSATSLRLATQKDIDRAELEQSLWQAIDIWYAKFRQGRAEEILQAYQAKLIIPIGKVINVERDKESLSGIFRGIDGQARLILEKKGKRIHLSPAEILSIEKKAKDMG